MLVPDGTSYASFLVGAAARHWLPLHNPQSMDGSPVPEDAMRNAARLRVLAAALALTLTILLLGPAPKAQALFHPAIYADQIVKYWFFEQRGARVQIMLSKLSKEELWEIYDLVEAHPVVLEIKDNPPDQRSVRAYQGLTLTFRDLMNNK